MAIQINNDSELIFVIQNIQQSVLESIAQKATDLIKEYVLSEVYQSYEPIGLGNGFTYIEGGGGEFGRTQEFADAWGEIDKDINSIIIGYLDNMITAEPEAYIHSSPNYPIDAEKLADLIFGGYEVFKTGYEIPARDAWDMFITDLNIQLPLWVQEALVGVI